MNKKRISLSDLPERYRKQAQEQIASKARTSVHSADSQPVEPLALGAKEAGPAIRTKVRVVVHSRPTRLHDTDGISIKAVLDGLVRGGVLPDDTAESVSEVTFTAPVKAEKGKEETVIELWED